jgi:hypothetical protein
MESLTYEKLVPRLVEALPEIPIDPYSVADNLAYLVFNDLMCFVNTTVEASGDAPLLAKIFRFIEEVAQAKDVQVQDVLQDALYLLAVGPNRRCHEIHGTEYSEGVSTRRRPDISKIVFMGRGKCFPASKPNKALQLTAR